MTRGKRHNKRKKWKEARKPIRDPESLLNYFYYNMIFFPWNTYQILFQNYLFLILKLWPNQYFPQSVKHSAHKENSLVYFEKVFWCSSFFILSQWPHELLSVTKAALQYFFLLYYNCILLWKYLFPRTMNYSTLFV